MRVVDVQEAQSQFSELLTWVALGEDVVIAQAGTPVARLFRVEATSPRRFGGMTLTVPDDFDAPSDEAEVVAWQ